MKEYNVKYNIDDEVYVLTNKKIYQTKIENLRVIEVKPYISLTIVNRQQVLTEMDGITIEYLIETHSEQIPGVKGISTNYEWFKQEDVYLDKEELIRKIK